MGDDRTENAAMLVEAVVTGVKEVQGRQGNACVKTLVSSSCPAIQVTSQ